MKKLPPRPIFAWKLPIPLTISVVVTALALFVYVMTFVGERPTPAFEFIHRLELASLDARFRIRGKTETDPRIVIVEIDRRSQEALGRWPFHRSHFATLLDVLREGGARVAAFDICFSQPDETRRPLEDLRLRLADSGVALDPRVGEQISALEIGYDHDLQLAAAIERYGRVILGNIFVYTEAEAEGLSDAVRERNFLQLWDSAISRANAVRPEHGTEDYRNLVRLYADLNLVFRGAQTNVEILVDAARGKVSGSGFLNVPTEPDTVVRRTLLVLPYGRSDDYADWDFYPSLHVEAVRAYLDFDLTTTVLNFGGGGIESLEIGDGLTLRPDEVGRKPINFHGPARSYEYVSLSDVIAGQVPPERFEDQLVLVGSSAAGIGDLVATPYGALDFPGVELHANIIDNILNDDFLERGFAQEVIDLVLILLFGIPVGLWLGWTRPRWMALALLLLLPFGVGMMYAFHQGWWLNATTPTLFTLIPNIGLVALYRVLVEEREKHRVRAAFQQYVTPEVVRRLLQNPEQLKPRKAELTVLFSDVRGFTSLSETLDAEVLADLLNEYFTAMTEVVFQHHGTLDKYIGDALMAFWGAPFEDLGRAPRSCRAALRMRDRLAQLTQVWETEGRPQFDVGVGIHEGVAAVGNMGSELRYGYTALGDTVNLAARVEGLNKVYGTQILVTESVVSACATANPSEFLFRELDLIRVKGKREAVTVHELVDYRDAAADWLERVEVFTAGRDLYRRRQWLAAQRCFDELIERWSDGPSRVFAESCHRFALQEPPPDWDGISTLQHK